MDHIREQPKRMIGNGKGFSFLKGKHDDNSTVVFDDQSISTNSVQVIESQPSSFFEAPPNEMKMNEDEINYAEADLHAEGTAKPKKNVSWASLVNPAATALSAPNVSIVDNNEAGITKSLESMTLNDATLMLNTLHEEKVEDNECGGQFSDAEDDESIEIPEPEHISDDDDGDEYASIGSEFSDEECDVYILDPEEVEERKRLQDSFKAKQDGDTSVNKTIKTEKDEILKELEMEFPSLAAASTVPYEGSDDGFQNEDNNVDQIDQEERLKKAAEEEQKRKEASLQPVSKSGKLYNTLGKYKKLASEKGSDVSSKQQQKVKNETSSSFSFIESEEKQHATVGQKQKITQSRVIGGTGMSGQSNEVNDDGEGWVTCEKDIVAMKATGTLDPFHSEKNSHQAPRQQENLPLKSCRCACATTDFAMQNVILQMNLELLTVDGVKVRKLKSWVQRCSTCTEVYTAMDSARLFCSKCGSASIQRVAASVDGKTGRLKLHLKKNYQHKIRGTRYALPKPGKQNRFMGDLILSEDQLMYGAISQRVKQVKSKNTKAAQSIFGADIASTVGCNADLNKLGDIKVGFGRKNPNATKFGRERRGKTKKSDNKVCGLRRY